MFVSLYGVEFRITMFNILYFHRHENLKPHKRCFGRKWDENVCDWRKPNKEELHKLYVSSKEMRRAVPIGGNDMWEVSNKYRILVLMFKAEWLFERSRHIRGINIKALGC